MPSANAREENVLSGLDHISWRVRPFSWDAAEKLSSALGIPFVAAVVLAGRGFDNEEAARAFLEVDERVPSPFLFGDMQQAVERIEAAIVGGHRVIVHGDYDADGITATALMVEGLAEYGLNAEWYLPSRFKEGYGLSREAVETISKGGPGLLVTVDCGVNYPVEVALAQEKGLDVIVIDHHRPGSELPACVVIHPAVGDYPNEDLCGVGLALKVLHGLHVRRDGGSETEVPERLRRFLDLVAVGTIADLAPLRGENRYYVKEGLKLVSIGARMGLRALAQISDCTGRTDSSAVAFRLAPRLNAAGRLKDPSPPLRLLLTADEREAAVIAADLHKLNGERQEVERQMVEEAVARVEAMSELPLALVLAGEGWHEGVVGIVASRLVERYNRPTVLLGVREGVAKGSGRSVPGYDLMAGLNACAEHLTIYGGHEQAVGLTLPELEIPAFASALVAHAADSLGLTGLAPSYRADAVMPGEDMNADTALALAALGPFGSGNPRPRLLVVGASIRNPESTRTGAHLRCSVEVDGVKARAIGFGMADQAAVLQGDGDGLVLGVQLQVDQWQGTIRPQLQLEKIGKPQIGGFCERRCGPDCRWWGLDALPDTLDLTEPSAWTRDVSKEGKRGPGRAFDWGSPPRNGDGQKGRLSLIAQVLSTGEPVTIATCSVPHLLARIETGLPRDGLVHLPLACVGRGCGLGREGALGEERVLVAEWDALSPSLYTTRSSRHVVVADPPYRRQHVETLEELRESGATLHMAYGEEERRTTAALLRYLVHPRFAMVCMYRAAEAGLHGRDRMVEAARLASVEGGVTLGPGDLARAEYVLARIGLGARPQSKQARIEAKDVPAYAAAEADFEESVRLCQIL